MYIATVLNKGINSAGNCSFAVTFSDGVHPITEPCDASTVQALNDFIYRRLDTLNNLVETAVFSVPNGPFNATALAAQTQAQIDLINFQKYLSATEFLAAAKTMGWIDGTEAVVVNAKTKTLALLTANIPKLFN